MRSLVNPTKSYAPCDKVTFFVPESDDEEYADMRRREWEVRIYMQMFYRSKMNYNIYFFTLTYSDAMLPHFTYFKKGYYDFVKKDYAIEKVKIPCFNREHIRKFVRGIQQDLLRYYDIKDIDYIICSEYGKHTQRPHYHGVLFIPKERRQPDGSTKVVGSFTIHELIKKHWSEVTSVYRKKGNDAGFASCRLSRGWVLPAKYNGGKDLKGKVHKPLQVQPQNLVKSAKYVCKYCTKDLSFYGRKDVQVAKKDLEKDKTSEMYQKFRRSLPFLKVSQHFGECICDVVLNEDLPKWAAGVGRHKTAYEDVCFGIKTALYDEYTPIPQYCLRKMFESRVLIDKEEFYPFKDKSVTFDIFTNDDECDSERERNRRKIIKYIFEVHKTDFYRECLPHLFDRDISQVKERVDSFYRSWYCHEKFRDWCKDKFITDASFLQRYADKSRALAIYKVVYQNRCSPCHLTDYLRHPLDFRNYDVYKEELCCVQTPFGTFDVMEEYPELVDCKNFGYISKAKDDDFLYDDAWLHDLPCYNGTESLDFMCDNAYSFYKLRGDVIRNPYDGLSAPVEVPNIQFNTFSCFAGFDSVLYIIDEFSRYLKSIDLNIKVEKMDNREFNNAYYYDEKRCD